MTVQIVIEVLRLVDRPKWKRFTTETVYAITDLRVHPPLALIGIT
ncbi:hypothetical protein OG470_00445 [Micromonospora sp. NBC_00389]